MKKIKQVKTLQGLVGKEGDIVKFNKDYFEYFEDFNCCECGVEEEITGWRNVSNAVNYGKRLKVDEHEIERKEEESKE